MKKPTSTLALFAVVLLLATSLISCSGCGATHNGSGTSTSPAASVQTPLQRVIVLNAAVAKANLSLTLMVQQLNTSGVLSVPQTRAALEISQRVASTSETIRTLADGQGDWITKAVAIKKALDDLSLTKRITNTGIINPQIVAAFDSVLAVVNLVQMEVSR